MTDPPAHDSEDLDALVRRVDPDRWLSSRFIGDPERRADVVALYAYDHELARAPKVASNSLLGEIRLTWWREALDEIFEGGAVRRHPTAQALAGVVARRALPREPLEAMIDARYRELDPEALTYEDAKSWAFATGGVCSRMVATILDPARDKTFADDWGAIWSLALRLKTGNIARDERAKVLAEVRLSLGEARSVERRQISIEAFPAVAHVTFADAYARGRDLSNLGKRLRIFLAVARGRI